MRAHFLSPTSAAVRNPSPFASFLANRASAFFPHPPFLPSARAVAPNVRVGVGLFLCREVARVHGGVQRIVEQKTGPAYVLEVPS